jgi:hypothetical protein
MPITPPVTFVDAPPGWNYGDPLPPGATPVNAANLNGTVTALGAYTDTKDSAQSTARTAAVNTINGRLNTLESAGALGVLANVIGNDGSWTVRPVASVVIWIGGGPDDDPTSLMHDGDIWYPSSTV